MIGGQVVVGEPALHPHVCAQHVDPVLVRMPAADAQILRPGRLRRAAPIVERMVRVAVKHRAARPMGVVDVHEMATRRLRRIEDVRIAGPHELQPDHVVLRRLAVAPCAPLGAVERVPQVAVVEHAEPRFPLLVEQDPVELVVQGALEVGESPRASREAPVDAAAPVPAWVGMRHRRFEHVRHRARQIRLGRRAGMEIEDRLAGLGVPLRPVFHGVFLPGLIREAREAHRISPRRPQKRGRQIGARRVEADLFRVFLQKVPDADGETAPLIREVHPAVRPFGVGERPLTGAKLRGEAAHARLVRRTGQRWHPRWRLTGLEQRDVACALDAVGLGPAPALRLPPGALAEPGAQLPIA